MGRARTRGTAATAAAVVAALALAACRAIPPEYPPVDLPNGIVLHDLAIPTKGSPARAGQLVEIHYRGWLESGVEFDSSLDRGQPIRFRLGDGRVPRGLEQGIDGMRLFGRRRIVVPPELGFGDQGSPPLVPAGATLVFEVELLAIED
jgi:peptidylprolyl isomerase